MALDQLLPCPFCDCQDIEVHTRKTTIVECRGCGAMFIKRSEKSAVDAWNTRFFPRSVGTLTSDFEETIKPTTPDD